MTREILRDLEAGAMDALRLYAAIVRAPFFVAKALLGRKSGAPTDRTRSGNRASSDASDTRRH
jgi:hypothetical protein